MDIKNKISQSPTGKVDSNNPDTVIPRSHHFNIVLLFGLSFLVILVGIFFFLLKKPDIISNNEKNDIDTSVLIDNGFPANYKECFDATKDSINNYDEKTKTYSVDLKFKCNFEISDTQINKKAYDFCMQNGGMQTAGYPVKCIECPDVPASCSLTYYNPKIAMPNTHTECRNYSNKVGFPYLRTGLDFCEVEVSLQGAIDKTSTRRLIDDCSKINSEMSFVEKDENNCKLTFYKYVCPEDNVIYCIDPSEERNKIVCSDEAQEWYKKNCSGYKGIISKQN